LAKKTVLTPTVARAAFEAHFDVVDGKTVGFNKPRGAADRTQLVDSLGQPVAFEVAIQKLVEASPDKDKLLRSGLASGTGSHTTNVRTDSNNGGNDGELRGASRILAGLRAGALDPKKSKTV